MKKIKIDWVSILLFVGTLMFTALTFKALPSAIPNTFTLNNQHTMMDTNLAIAIRCALLLLLSVIAQVPNLLTKIDLDNPKLKTIRFYIRLTISILIIHHIGTIAISLGYTFNKNLYILVLVSFAMIILGNRLPQIKMNRYFGFRLPWTIRDEETWRITHRLLGYTSMPFAIIQITLSFFVNLNWALFLGFGLWLILSTLYSLIFYIRKFS